MLNLRSLYGKVSQTSTLLSESKKSHLRHLFEDGTLSFDEIRNIFKDVFTGNVTVFKTVRAYPLHFTYKNGRFMFSNGGDSFKEPFTADKICAKCKCALHEKDAIDGTMTEFIGSLKTLDQKSLNSIFANGQNYCKFNLIVPSEKLLKDYGNHCFVQCDKVSCYDDTFKNITEDDENTAKLKEHHSFSKFLTACNPQLQQDKIKVLKSMTQPQAALQTILSKLENLIDGIGYKATVNDYVRERYAKCIVNCALKHGIDLYHNSDFVKELIARLSYLDTHRPNRSDLITYAKRDGVNWKSQEYKDMLDDLESSAEATNDGIIKPIEELVLSAGVQILKCLAGLVSVDPRQFAQRLMPELDSTIKILEDTTEGLTPEKIKTLRHCMKNLEIYQSSLPEDGFLVMYKDAPLRISGKFGAVNNLMKLMNY